MPPDLHYHRVGKTGDNDSKDTFKLGVIGVFALSSLVLTVYTIGYMNQEIFLSVYPLIPHMYLIPIILLALWYPKRGLQITILLIAAILVLTIYLYFMGLVLDPFISLLYAGMDIAIFVVLALYAKDRTLVESFLKGFFEHSGLGEHFEESIRHPSEKAKVKFEGAFEEVVKALHSSDEEMREEAVRALGELNDPRAVEPLISILNDDNRYIRREAAKSLGRIGDERAIGPLINGLKDDDRYGREGAAEGLGDMGEKALEPLIAAMKDDDWHVRMGAAISLRIIGDKAAIDPLISALEDENRFVRREVTKSLGRIGDERVVEPLIGTLDDPDRSVRMRGVSALAKFDDERTISPLIRTLNDEDSGVRLRAIRALEDSDDPRVAKALNNSVIDEYPISSDNDNNDNNDGA